MDAAELLAAAWDARTRAYAPYSRFAVGAAVLSDDGRVFVGCNVENASYGLTLCAERVALCTAVAAGARGIAALAVVSTSGASLCGACRQVLAEFAAADVPVHLAGGDGTVRSTSVGALLPDAFDRTRLRQGDAPDEPRPG